MKPYGFRNFATRRPSSRALNPGSSWFFVSLPTDSARSFVVRSACARANERQPNHKKSQQAAATMIVAIEHIAIHASDRCLVVVVRRGGMHRQLVDYGPENIRCLLERIRAKLKLISHGLDGSDLCGDRNGPFDH